VGPRLGILPRMAEITSELLRQQARLSGFDWTEAEVEKLRGIVARAFEALARLEQLPLHDVEPTTQYRML
jgi:Asp-tRNA(Asn)/Glu-tRNA(Gln) amidotransferase C subunit